MAEYVIVPTREGLEGVKDKAALVDALARRYAGTHREFVTAVRQIVAHAGNSAEAQVRAWADFCTSIPYHREHGEIFQDPWTCITDMNGIVNPGTATGGDCDDLVICLLAGLHALAIPCVPDIVMAGPDGVHIRARVGLPPTNPPQDMSQWTIIDPVEQSERQWAMLPPTMKPPKLGTATALGHYQPDMQVAGLAGDPSSGELGLPVAQQGDAIKAAAAGASSWAAAGWALAAVAALGWWSASNSETGKRTARAT